MRSARATVGILAGLLVVRADPGRDARPAAAESDTLTVSYVASGFRVIHRVNRANDLVAVSLYLLGGTRQLTEQTAGIEALLLRASGNGTQRYPDAQTRRAMARTGSVDVLEAGVDWTVFGFIGLRQDVDSTWAVFADRLLHPSLTPDGVRLARDLMIASVRRRYSEPDERIQRIANQVTFVDHPYALDPEGTEASLQSITPELLAEYARTQLVKSRMLLVIVGNIERPQIEALVAATLSRLPAGEYRWTLPPVVPKQRESHWLIEPRALPTNYILGYFTGPAASKDDYAAFRVATGILSSQLFDAIRVQHSLSYAAYAPFLDRAVAVGGMYASTPKPEQVLPLMYEQVRILTREPIDRYVLRRFANQYIIDYLSGSGTNFAQTDILARADLYLGDYRQTDKYVLQLRRLAPEDIYKAIERYMRIIQWAYMGDTLRMNGAW